jgi:hypothetical protein
MFQIEMLPARNGDGLWIRYGDPGRPHNLLIDCGFLETYRAVRTRLDQEPRVELFVLTHIDSDHIEGAVALLGDRLFDPGRVGDVWFNGWQHLAGDPEPEDALGARQGEYFAALLEKREFPWNAAFGQAPVCAAGAPPRVELPGGMALTVLSPTPARLAALRTDWKKQLRGKMTPGSVAEAMALLHDDRRYPPDALGGSIDLGKILDGDVWAEDERAPNGSSIVLLAEYEGKRALLAGDAFPSVLAASLEALGASRDAPLELDALKVSHHGSSGNTSRALLDLLRVRRALVSTNGDQHGHPHAAALARIVDTQPGVELHFNYESETTRGWLDPVLCRRLGIRSFGPPGQPGWLAVDL